MNDLSETALETNLTFHSGKENLPLLPPRPRPLAPRSLGHPLAGCPLPLETSSDAPLHCALSVEEVK